MAPSTATNLERGRMLAALLAGAWRSHPPPGVLNECSDAEIIPLAIKTGAGALAWWKLRHHDPRLHPGVSELQRVYDLHKLEAFMHQARLEHVIERMRLYGVEPLLSKGWAVVRLYPELGLRPYGAQDLHVDPSRAHDAHWIVKERGQPADSWVDLHPGVPELPERPMTAVYQRSRLLQRGAVPVRCLSAEDQLRQLSLYFARHGGWRPLWLCDIGVYLESLPADFDWDYCMAGDARLSAWVRSVLGLTVRLLEADGKVLPKAIAVEERSWLDAVVLDEWGRCEPCDSRSREKTPLKRYLLRPWLIWQPARQRKPNALEAAFHQSADPETAPIPLRWAG